MFVSELYNYVYRGNSDSTATDISLVFGFSDPCLHILSMHVPHSKY